MIALTVADSLETLLLVAFFITISAFSNWMKRKSGQTEDGKSGTGSGPGPGQRPRSRPSPPGMPPPARTTFDWQEELRRLLTGEIEAPPPPAPPPINVPLQRGEGAPPPLRSATPESRPRATTAPAPEAPTQLGRLTEAAAAYQRGSDVDAWAAADMQQLAALPESTSRLQWVGHLDERVGLYMRQVGSRPVGLTTIVRHGGRSPEIQQAIGWVRRPHALRQAIIASMILAPPKGLEL
jgi:hypothetical protein